eukprot:gnl/Spiro4/499_TR279_c0_g1_i1.p1 gnl/Spiro4/499_TR279_c0_g1~~gnl/Spiro4/499_TR279_c0_g1_i1.p1  ORF type:complete len:1040 (-),score=324.70 gnl/Spiro4/499_TR279_c0_g1_i1:25-3087(-)
MSGNQSYPASGSVSTSTGTTTDPYFHSYATSSSYYYDLYPSERKEGQFVGLSNQGATCYMNSLLQTLFMTPEFRSTLFRWRYNAEKDGDPEECIPLQLQKLFGKMQIGKLAYVETKDLTKSFGWSSYDSFQQHDVQELNRILFDNLENCFKGTEFSDFINLYKGYYLDALECQECGGGYRRRDEFLDLNLVIRDTTSLEEALDLHVKAEVLDGSNQYMCSTCNKKVDATKGLKIQECPYLLTIQLKRFDIDYSGDVVRRIKLNDEVSFPTVLDMTKWLNQARRPSASAAANADPNAPHQPQPVTTQSSVTNLLNREASATGAYTYTLFAILIHSGNAMGGHYYSYIKDFSTGKWHNFNDSYVSELSQGDLEKTFGGTVKYSDTYGMSYQLTRSANAYMLVYRRVDPRNLMSVPDTEVPDYILNEIEAAEREMAAKREEEKRKRDNLVLRVSMTGVSAEKQVTANKAQTYNELLALAIDAFKTELGDKAERIDRMRLRTYDPTHGVMRDAYTGQETSTLEKLQFYTYKHLCLEVLEDGEEFQNYNPNDMMLTLQVVDEKGESFLPSKKVFIARTATVHELKEKVFALSNIPIERQRLYTLFPQTIELVGDQRPLSNFQFQTGDKVPVELNDGPNYVTRILEREKNMLEVSFNKIGSKVHDQKITIDRRKTVADFKLAISPIIGLAPNMFKLQRSYSSLEIKNENELLYQVCHSGGTITVEAGTALKPDEYRINFFIQVNVCEDDEQTFLCDLPVRETMLISELKAQLSERTGIPATHMRLREKYGCKATKVYQDQQSVRLAVFSLFDGREMTVQKLETPETWTDDNLLLGLQSWYPSEFGLGVRKEIVIPSRTTMAELRELVRVQSGLPAEHILICKAPYYYAKIEKDQIPRTPWDQCIQASFQTTPVNSAPWYLRDGDVILFKDNRDPERSTSDYVSDYYGYGPAISASYTYERPKEKALKILSKEQRAQKKAEAAAASAAASSPTPSSATATTCSPASPSVHPTTSTATTSTTSTSTGM